MSCKKGVLRNFAKFTEKHLCQSLCFNKAAGLKQCFPVYFAKFQATSFLPNTSGRLLLLISSNTISYHNVLLKKTKQNDMLASLNEKTSLITDSKTAVLQDNKIFFLKKEKLHVRFTLVKGYQIINKDHQNTKISDH